MATVEKSAKTKDEAVELALKELGASYDEVVIEVIEEGSKGLFGIGSKDATVKVTANPSPERRAKNFLGKLFELSGEDVTINNTKKGNLFTVEKDLKAFSTAATTVLFLIYLLFTYIL